MGLASVRPPSAAMSIGRRAITTRGGGAPRVTPAMIPATFAPVARLSTWGR